jgi:hypothetical protein
MTYNPPSGPGGQYEPPPDPPVESYRPPQFYQQPYATPGYQYPNPYQYGVYAPPSRPIDGTAIAALVVSCVAALGLCAYGLGGVLGIAGAVLGHIARSRIRASGAGGDGLALAGVIVGWIAAAIGILAVVGLILLLTLSDDFN